MLDYTKAIVAKTKKDLDTSVTVFKFSTQILYIAYLIYLLFTFSNIWYLHLALLIISIAFLIFDLITTNHIHALSELKGSLFGNRNHKAKLRNAKRKKETVRKIKFYLSHTLKLIVLAASLYPMIASPDTVHPISIICTTIMALAWLFLIVLEAFKMIFSARMDLFYEAIHADMEFISKPVSAVKNTFNKFLGREIEEKPEASKERKYLDELVKSNKNEKYESRNAAKAARSEKIATWIDNHLPKKKRKSDDENVEETDFITITSDTDESV